jgi:hypothetical protein
MNTFTPVVLGLLKTLKTSRMRSLTRERGVVLVIQHTVNPAHSLREGPRAVQRPHYPLSDLLATSDGV